MVGAFQSVPGTAQTDVACEHAGRGCGGGCEDKGMESELHCMATDCQTSPFCPLPLLNQFSP